MKSNTNTGKRRLSTVRAGQLAVESMVRAYFAKKGAVLTNTIHHLADGSVVVRFRSGGPYGLKKMMLYPSSIKAIEEGLLA